MVAKSRAKALTKVWNYLAGESVIDVLPRDNLIRRVSLHADITLSTPAGGTVATGLKTSDILNLLKRIEIIYNGNDNVFDVDAKTYIEALRFGYGTVAYKDTVVTPIAGSKTTFHIEVPIDFAFDKKLISDTRALCPAPVLGSLQLRLTWGVIGDVYTTPNATVIDAATKVRVSITEIYDNGQGDDAIQPILDNLTKVYEGVQQDEITGANTSYPADEQDIQMRPVGALHLQGIFCVLLNITDGNPAYSNTAITQMKLANVKGGGEAIFHGIFADLQREQKTDYGFETDNPIGRVMIDYADLRFGGLQNNDPDALKWKILTPAPAAGKVNAVRIFKRYIVTG